jgi:ectoine hydroxylase-related dioxygenase (phytanoyl-CoA dioxygenase family)
VQLTADQVRFFVDNGYLSLDAIATKEEILEIRAIIEKLFEERRGEREGAYGELIEAQPPKEANSPQILNPVNYAPKLHKTQCFQNALSIAKQLLGNDARFFLDVSILKRARVGAGTPWHQDAAFRDPRFEYKEVAIWVPLQEVNVESGCLHFIPGSHKNSVMAHRPVNNDPASQALECVEHFNPAAEVACPLPAGGCTLHHPETLHSAGPNVSNSPRLAYIMTFAAAPRPAAAPRTFPWLDERETPVQERKRQWMRHGGIFITAWRRVRRGDFSNWQSLVYWIKRGMRTVRKGA